MTCRHVWVDYRLNNNHISEFTYSYSSKVPTGYHTDGSGSGPVFYLGLVVNGVASWEVEVRLLSSTTIFHPVGGKVELVPRIGTIILSQKV